ncbi:hypothetical protein MLD38_020386 [Melastoma candidum]|uniref:Uncharacterized protein n=1 Tax=Melastoma candidum TaxID=119954 RepID=A0ACB9QEL8_9MYRT|nr:hypothetical protein MLD38_020386 [Melastoma candidum]
MGSPERSKKKVQLWKKATVHFSLCFIMGFFTGFASTGIDQRAPRDQARRRVFGTWPVAVVSSSEEKVNIKGPVCNSSQLLGQHLRGTNDNDTGTRHPSSIHTSSFAFNSSVLWDPERWGRPSSSQATSDKDSIKFVKEIFEAGDANVKDTPGNDCSKIMVWHLHQSRQA